MNADWGYFLTKKSPIRGFLIDLWHATINPLDFRAKHQPEVLRGYRCDFVRVFMASPVSFHAHSSDAIPVIPSMTVVLEEDPPVRPKRGLTEAQKNNYLIATFESQMVSYHGPMAHGGRGLRWNQKSVRIGNPQIIALAYATDKRRLLQQFKNLVATGHIAIVLEMVSQNDGRVVTAQEWKIICECCEEAGLYLVVDEVLTVWRCGAPFAHLLPQYSEYKPSFVVFGKALGACGLAVHWDGVHLNRLGYAEPCNAEDAANFIDLWDHKPSRVISPDDALRSWGYILLSEEDRWCTRALQIGQNLRRAVARRHPDVPVGGFGALIYLPSEVAGEMDIVGAAVNGDLTRWLPYLDEGLTEFEHVMELFQDSGAAMRRALAKSYQNVTMIRCISCSDYLHEVMYACKKCGGNVCGDCVARGASERHQEKRCLSGNRES
ncbi:hypothetical protein Z517_09201 [Fonsecaea pedrosoi CBS 271.37]|uniref:Unplaced genomic scaffold supercont1.6, whole genome shotgun sequence n=1 Tax=Fonsecaea pedrosoi CBS 271.37 TaxID=1442368 RepID=A0A0D2ER68_9EURO|nr:uncharacterized protein Z517_09201 [Fonsecaea pedrosoi CBS 271.37]KIW76757.1 hypothetical protein Z517_09201 [Fonsecaea pedrosoi CBS 271.37]